MAAGSSSISRSSLLNISAIASVISRPSFSVRIVDSDCSGKRPWMKKRSTLGCSSTRLTYSSTLRWMISRAESVAKSIDGKTAAHSMSRSRSPIAWNRSDLSVKCR